MPTLQDDRSSLLEFLPYPRKVSGVSNPRALARPLVWRVPVGGQSGSPLG